MLDKTESQRDRERSQLHHTLARDLGSAEKEVRGPLCDVYPPTVRARVQLLLYSRGSFVMTCSFEERPNSSRSISTVLVSSSFFHHQQRQQHFVFVARAQNMCFKDSKIVDFRTCKKKSFWGSRRHNTEEETLMLSIRAKMIAVDT